MAPGLYAVLRAYASKQFGRELEELSLEEIVRLVDAVLPGRANVVLRAMGVDGAAVAAGKRTPRLQPRPHPEQLGRSASSLKCQGVAGLQPKSSSPQPHQGSAKGGLIISKLG